LQELDGVVPCELSENMFGVDQWWVLKKRKKKKVFLVSETDPST
jgi:hypothetical protein